MPSTVALIVENLSNMIEFYIPVAQVDLANRQVFEVVFKLLQSDTQAEIKPLLVNQLFLFASTKFHVPLFQSWIEKGYIHDLETKDKIILKLDKS